ncbi:MAG TPA: acylphosphatase [Euryarchaeota archaeon]|nr:acylphosphatase [Euryarchaeota archaeon]
MKIRVHALISGCVQGVCYRAYTCEKAEELGVRGWVRNLHDGRVEAVLEGDKSSVESLVKCLKSGPAHARVESIDTTPEDYEGEFRDFTVRY